MGEYVKKYSSGFIIFNPTHPSDIRGLNPSDANPPPCPSVSAIRTLNPTGSDRISDPLGALIRTGRPAISPSCAMSIDLGIHFRDHVVARDESWSLKNCYAHYLNMNMTGNHDSLMDALACLDILPHLNAIDSFPCSWEEAEDCSTTQQSTKTAPLAIRGTDLVAKLFT